MLALTASAATPAPAVPVLGPLASSAPLPTAGGVARALAGPLADPGLGIDPHVEVIDALSGAVLLDHRGQLPATPASTQKLLTAASALLVLGPQTRLTTRALSSGANLYLVGGGDPTLTTQPLVTGYPPAADLTALAREVASTHPGQVGQVIGVGSAYGGPDLAPGWSSYYLVEGEVARVRSLEVDEGRFEPGLLQIGRHDDPVLAAAQTFHDALAAAGVQTGEAGVGTVPAGARLVASVVSPPVSALVERMLDYSDADLAEGLGRQVAIRSGLPPTFAGVSEALGRVARRLGLPAGQNISDASGLSRSDAIAPAALTKLLRQAAVGPYPQLRPLVAALPIAGFTGTLALRFTLDAPGGLGHVRAKTGWLNGAAALAGFVTTASGRLLIFAALAPAPGRGAGEAGLDRIAAALAGCGCA
ncbi:MAG TPA: D-alanyl-D-alanine carboxypeptidase/D-alanyl-D-alanine-endopeptidase [Frankiaceae bacterium]|nr:D-alanyl-D-alanine carboxypeptidase/D-alanyl-D-alanine-endopeptidase [Frankiaceae bacterium]